MKGLLAPGKLYDIGGRRLHAVITGQPSAHLPIVLEAGLTAMSSCWAWVQQDLSAHTQVLSYDRAGLGWSDPAPASEPRDARNIAQDLHNLLDAAQFPRPFAFVGHSMGGFFGRAYAQQFPNEIAAVVLVDASHPEQIERSLNIRKALRRYFWFLKASPLIASTGLMRPFQEFGIAEHARGLPEPDATRARACFSSAQHMRTSAREAEEWFRSAAQVKGSNLGQTPLLVLTALEKSMAGWHDLQKELADLSTRSRHLVIPGDSHTSMLSDCDHARRVSSEILTVTQRQDWLDKADSNTAG
jgi:pimeloyl-ACP methyl ester carboxylesterase